MSTLTNQQINLTYAGLIKTTDNAAIDGTPKALEDGVGNALPIQVGTSRINFTNTIDFSGATVTGLVAGGLVAGTGDSSIKSADFLTGDPSTASASGSIAIGNGNTASALATTVVGRNSQATGTAGVAIGNSASVTGENAIGISGENCTAAAQRSIAIGRQAQVTIAGANSVALGNFAKSSGNSNISLATCLVNVQDNKADSSIMIVPGQYGCTNAVGATNSIVIGASSSQLERTQATGAIAIGYDNQASAVNSVSIGTNVLANRVDTVSVKKLEVQAQGSGIVMYSPDGTAYEVTVANGGTLTVTAI